MPEATPTPPTPPKRRPGRPCRTDPPNVTTDATLPIQHDASKPLIPKRLERLVQLMLRGQTQADAYRQAWRSKATDRTCETQASRIVRQPEISARLAWLRARASSRALDAQTPDPDGVLDLAQALRQCTRIISGRGERSADRIRAIEVMGKLAHWYAQPDDDDSHPPDPARLAEFCRAAEAVGMHPVDMAQQQRQEPAPAIPAPSWDGMRAYGERGGDTDRADDGP